MSVMDALGVAAKCWEVAMMVYQQYQTQKEVAASVGQYVSIVKLYQSSLNRLMVYIQQEQTNTVRVNDPQWAEDMKTFASWAEEDAKDAAYLQHELEKIRDNKWWKNMFIQAQDRFQEHQTRIYKKLEIIKFFMTMDMWKAGNQDRKDIDFAITDEEGRYFWHEHIGSGKREVTVEGLVGALQQFLSETQKFRSIEQQLLGVLKVTADTIVSNDQITIYEYNSFICRFGPLANILKKASAVCTIDGNPQPWFRAIADRRKLELEFANQLAAYDREHPDEVGATSPKIHGFNTWVLRFSSEPREHFVWSYMHNRKPFHVLIRNSPKGYHLKDLPKGHTEHKYYETVIDLIDAESERMNFKVDKSHLKEWQDLFDYNTAEDPEGESRYATFAADEDDDDEAVSSPSTVASPEKVALTVDNTVKDPATAEKVSAIAAAIIQQHETTTTTSPTPNPTTQTIIETKATEKHEPQNMTIIIDRVEQNGTTPAASATPATTTTTTTTPAPAETPAPAATTTTTSPSSSNAPAASSPTSTSSDDHVDANAAKSAAAAADAIDKAKDLTIATPDPRASKPKPAADDDDARRGPAEASPKPVKSCCTVM